MPYDADLDQGCPLVTWHWQALVQVGVAASASQVLARLAPFYVPTYARFIGLPRPCASALKS
eukprot:18366-Prorocentrum_minimum.AAC.1